MRCQWGVPRLRRVDPLPNPELDIADRWVAEHLGDLALEGADGGAIARLPRREESTMTTITGTDPVPELVTVEPTTTAVVRGTIAAAEVTDFFDRSFSVLGEAIAAQGVAPTGPAFARYRGIPDETMDLEVGFPTDRAVEPDGSVEPGELPAGQLARLVHAGGFDGLGGAWQRLGAWIAEQGLTPDEAYWEVYLTEPSPEMDPAELRTEANWPVG